MAQVKPPAELRRGWHSARVNGRVSSAPGCGSSRSPAG